MAEDADPDTVRREFDEAVNMSPAELEEWLETEELLARPRFADHDRGTVESVLDLAESIATAPATWSFASATYAFPGPTMRSTRGTLSVPYAIAATAPAPPNAKTRSTFASAAAASTTGAGSPSSPGGEQRTISPTPATRAVTTPMITVLGYGARPPGT